MISKKYYPYIIFISAVLFFIPFLGHVHLFDWDEINFAESAREMIVTGNYSRVQIDFKPFWEKPPLFFWLQTISMHIFGISDFAARLPNAIIGIISLLTFYFIGKKLRDETFGLLWSLAYLGSFLPHLYFRSGIIDPTFNYFIFLTIFFLASSVQSLDRNGSLRYVLLAGITLGLAVLTKGPVAIIIIGLTVLVYWATIRFKKITSLQNVVVFALSFTVVASLWFGAEVLKNGTQFISEFITYQKNLFLHPVAGHGGPFYYHFVVVFLGCFPISVWALPRLFKVKYETGSDQFSFSKWMLILFWVVMMLFTIVTTKIVHYSSLAYYPLSFLAATFIYDALSKKTAMKKYLIVLLAIVGSLFSLLLIAVPIVAQHKDLIIPYLKDPFAVACLNTPVQWSGYEFLIGIFYLVALVVSLVIISKKYIFRGVVIMFYATAMCMFLYLVSVVPKIEQYSQAPAIRFYEELTGKDVYVTTIGFKSYAQYFYFRKMPGGSPKASDDNWLLTGEIDKPAYFVAKITSRKDFDDKPECKLIKQDGGFLFYERTPLAH